MFLTILDYIPFGKENAINRHELASMMNMSDRDMRKAIENEWENGHIILNLSDGSGYFQPTTEEINLIRTYKEQEESRAFNILKKTLIMGEYLKNNLSGQENLGG